MVTKIAYKKCYCKYEVQKMLLNFTELFSVFSAIARDRL